MKTLRGRFFLYFLLGSVATTVLTIVIAEALARRIVERRTFFGRGFLVGRSQLVAATPGRGNFAVLLLAGLIGTGVAALLAYALSTRLTKPIRELSDATRSV
ncbi:MAG: hypothetical protein ACRDH7_04120, partial [Actinomycetota bacterium]